MNSNSDSNSPLDVFPSDSPQPVTTEKKNPLVKFWLTLTQVGLGETSLRIGTGLISIFLITIVVVILKNTYVGIERNAVKAADVPATPVVSLQLPTLAPFAAGGLYPGVSDMEISGVTRQIDAHTIIPAKPRVDVEQYTVVAGDTVFGIAQKFNLRPETILWGNYYTLLDDPHRLKPGQQLNILPVNGVYYEWHSGDGLNGVANNYGVNPDVIVEWPGNRLSKETVGDYAAPNIAPGTWLIVPGGSRGFVTWSAPRISREDPAVAKQFGPGACGKIMDGPVGTQTYIFPTVDHTVSGYPYSPETNHRALDFGGAMGNSIFASDTGVVVYAGWNDYGYGNMVVIDHGFGWQSLYAHLSTLYVECGSYVYQGGTIGEMGSTGNSSGPHLHFEIMSSTYGKVNPLDFLQ